MSQYQRVIPRDLFNESKLLKGLGRLCLLIHEGVAPSSLEVVYDGEPFDIRQYEADGSLYAANLSVVRTGEDEIELDLRSPYNSTSPYPLLCHTRDGIHPVFEDDGSLNPEFARLCEGTANMPTNNVASIKKMIAKLPPKQQGKLIPKAILESLDRCGHLLHKLSDDSSAWDAAEEAAHLLQQYDAAGEWCEEYLAEEGS